MLRYQKQRNLVINDIAKSKYDQMKKRKHVITGSIQIIRRTCVLSSSVYRWLLEFLGLISKSGLQHHIKVLVGILDKL